MSASITINSDLGESFGLHSFGHDLALLDLIGAANIACGFHAGDPHVMSATVTDAVRAGVALGAHPGLPDLTGFGRRQMSLTPEEVSDLVLYQVGALSAFIAAAGAELSHVKAHGALYGMLARDQALRGNHNRVGGIIGHDRGQIALLHHRDMMRHDLGRGCGR